MVEALVFLVVGLAVGVAAGWFVGRLSAPTTDTSLGADLGAAQQQLAGARATIEGLRGQLADAQNQYRELREREQGDQLVLQAMAPIAQQMTAMQNKVAEIEKQRTAEHTQLAEQIKATQHAAGLSTAAAQRLESVMKDNQKRGAWGEMQLRRVIENAGMLNRVDFYEQNSLESGDKRPDVVVQLPGQKFMAIDAKVPFASFYRAQDEEISDAQRAELYKAHASELRAHVNELAKRQYWTGLTNSPEFTVAFMPAEAILQAGLDADPTLFDYAMNKNVILATPNNLLATLKAVAHVWTQETLVEQAKEIADLGVELFDRLGVVARHANAIGSQIGKTAAAYNQFASSLERNLLTTARRFEKFDGPVLMEVDGDMHTFSKPELTAALEGTERPELDAAVIEPSAESLRQIRDEVG